MLSPEDLLARTRRSLVRLKDQAGSLDLPALKQITASGWSVAATLAHLAFYDDWVAARWRDRLETGAFQDLPANITDLANRAGARGWQRVNPDEVVALAQTAATEVAMLLETLPREALEDAIASGRPAMIDRSAHWEPHLDEIEKALRPGSR